MKNYCLLLILILGLILGLTTAVGAQYEWSERVNVGGAFVYADYGDAEIKNPLLVGEYEKNDIYFLAFNVNWKF